MHLKTHFLLLAWSIMFFTFSFENYEEIKNASSLRLFILVQHSYLSIPNVHI
jgi:hypothetical protein